MSRDKTSIFIMGLALSSGCHNAPSHHPSESPAVSITPTGAISLSGDSRTPAEIAKKDTESIMPIPEGSSFVFNEKLGTMTLMVAKATQLAVNLTETTVKGPVAFDPPKQPTVSEIAEAKSDFWTVLGLRISVAIGICAAIFGLVKDWNLVMWGGISLAGAGLFGLFVQQHPILVGLVGVGIALIFIGPIIWHSKIKPLINDPK